MPLLLCCVLFSEGMLASLKVSLQRGMNTYSVQCIVPIHMDSHSRNERPSIPHTTLHIVPCPPSPLTPNESTPSPPTPHAKMQHNSSPHSTAPQSERGTGSKWLATTTVPAPTWDWASPTCTARTVHTLTEVSPRPVHMGLCPSQSILSVYHQVEVTAWHRVEPGPHAEKHVLEDLFAASLRLLMEGPTHQSTVSGSSQSAMH